MLSVAFAFVVRRVRTVQQIGPGRSLLSIAVRHKRSILRIMQIERLPSPTINYLLLPSDQSAG